MDALTQLIEPFLCSRPNPVTDALCREGIPRAARALPRAFADPADHDAREEMALASLLGGLALANAGLGAVHGFAAPIGGMHPAPHGAVCAALLPQVLRVNYRALSARAPHSHVLDRFDELGALLTGHKWGGAARAIKWVENLCAALHIPGLRTWEVRSEDVPLLCTRAAQASSMKANPIPLTQEELEEILEASL
jgi:alcohol dehydrogenase class IV